MDFYFAATLFLIAFVGSYFSGMLGIGGAIINYPLLLFLPPLFGFEPFSSNEVSGIVAIQVLVTTFGGVIGYRKSGHLFWPLIMTMGASVLAGSLLGSFGSSLMAEETVNLVFVCVTTIAALTMFIPMRDEESPAAIDFSKGIASLFSFFIGISSGIVGVGGAFLLIPLMHNLLRIPLRTALASSLVVTFISSIGTSVGKLSTGQVPFLPTLVIIVAGFIAAQLGAATSKRINVKVLKFLLNLFIFGTAIKLWVDFFS